MGQSRYDEAALGDHALRPWTSWSAGAQQWGLSSVRQGESSGTITHEIAHFAFRTGDNNNNPYAMPYRRVGSGPWDIMDRGSFNGPGGPHRRWVVPANEGASMPAGFMLRNRIRYEWLQPPQVLHLTRSGLEHQDSRSRRSPHAPSTRCRVKSPASR